MRQTMSLSIRLLQEADLENADAIVQAAFKSSESRLIDLYMYRKIQPDGWYLASQNGTPVGMVGTTDYAAFAYVGMMAVHPQAQRRGVGLALMRHLLAWLDKQCMPFILLDASPAGQPLYEKLGFVAYNPVVVFQRRSGLTCYDRPPHVQVVSVRDLDELVKYDADVFGADRGKVLHVLLTKFPERAFMLRGKGGQITGYVIAQQSRIGPWVMLQSCDAEELLRAALVLPYEETISVTVPAVNREAIELLQRYGFERVRTNRHMGRGVSGPPGQRQKIYAQTSLAVG